MTERYIRNIPALSEADMEKLKKLGRDRVDVTIGSALDLFGGSLDFEEVLKKCKTSVTR